MDVGIRELRDGLSKHLELVKAGEIITVTDHGKPVARIVPFEPAWPRHTIEELVAAGRITPARRPKGQLPPPIKTRGTVSDLIADQRR